MALLNYSSNEALERIYKMLSAAANPSDTEGLLGQMPFDEALTRIAQLLEGSLGDATLDFPDAAAASATFAGVVELANVEEANAGTSSSVVLTPESHSWAHEYGGVYSTGSVSQAFPESTWTKITGAFQGEFDNSGEVDGDWNDDRIVINENGDYFIQYKLSWWTWAGTTPKATVGLYNNGAVAYNSFSTVTFGASGTANNLAGISIMTMTSGTAIDIRASFSAAATVQFDYAQFTAVKMVG